MLSNYLVHATFSPDDPEIKGYFRLFDIQESSSIFDQEGSNTFGVNNPILFKQEPLNNFKKQELKSILYCEESPLSDEEFNTTVINNTSTVERVHFIIINIEAVKRYMDYKNSSNSQKKLLRQVSSYMRDYTTYHLNEKLKRTF